MGGIEELVAQLTTQWQCADHESENARRMYTADLLTCMAIGVTDNGETATPIASNTARASH